MSTKAANLCQPRWLTELMVQKIDDKNYVVMKTLEHIDQIVWD